MPRNISFALTTKIERLGQIRVVSVRQEPLALMNNCGWLAGIEAAREGFPEMDGSEFVAMFCRHMKCQPSTEVTRIEFEYLEPTE